MIEPERFDYWMKRSHWECVEEIVRLELELHERQSFLWTVIKILEGNEKEGKR